MKNMGIKTKFRMVLLWMFFMISIGVLVSSLFNSYTRYRNTEEEINNLEISYTKSLEEEENLKDEINKLQDPEYMARYTREKYLYSKKNEIIIKIED